MASLAPESSAQKRMLKAAKAWADSAETIKAVISATCPAPFQLILTSVADILSFFARTYCDLVANREDAEKLARACESAGKSICQLVARLPDFASDTSVSQLHKLLKEAYQYIRGTLTPPPRRKKQWIATLKSAANVKAVREKLNAYKDDIREQLNHVLFATSVSVRVAVADLPGDVWRAGELAVAESCRKAVQEELERLEVMRQQIHSLSRAGNTASAIVDRKADKLNDIVVAARFRTMTMQRDIKLGNMTLEQADANKIYQTVDKLYQEATEVAEKLNRPLTLEDWMVDSNSVAFNSDDDDSLLGEGASGVVYCGQMDNQDVAVKVFNIKGKTSRQIEAAIKKEIEAWHLISDNENIVSLLGVSTKVKYFVVSELCSNGTTRDYLSVLRHQKERWQQELVSVLTDAAKGLRFLHKQGLVHRDVKGTNIFVREDGSAALGDFGLSRVVGSISTTSASYQKFTLNWASPEQLTTNDARTLTVKADTWSFGVTILELLTDREPFSDTLDVKEAITTGKIGPHLPTAVPGELRFLVKLITECCKMQPQDRLSDDDILNRLRGDVHVPPSSSLNSADPLQKLLINSPRLFALQANESDAAHLQHVLELVVLQQGPLTSASIAKLLVIRVSKLANLLDALRPVLKANDGGGPVQLNDPDFGDYLTRRCTNPRFAVDRSAADLRIAALCLQLLSRELHPNMCQFKSASEASRRMVNMSPNERKELRGRIPAHVVYASRFWAAHICGSAGQAMDTKFAAAVTLDATWPKLQQCIKSFATTAMVFWIEVLAAVGALDTLWTAAVSLAPLLPHSKEARALFTEAATLLDRFPELGSGSPACIYIEVMPRLPRGSAMRSLLGATAVLPFPIAVAQSPASESVTLFRTLSEHSRPVSSVAVSSDGRTVASGSVDNTIILWEAATGRLLRTLKCPGPVLSISFVNDGRIIASWSVFANTFILWETATGSRMHLLEGFCPVELRCIAFSSDCRTIASGSDDRTVDLWDATTGQLLSSFAGHLGSVSSVAFSSDSHFVASGSMDNTIKLWEVATGRPLHNLVGHTGPVRSVTFSSDGGIVVSGSDDGKIRLWKVSTGQLLRTLEGRSGPVLFVTISKDGRTIASSESFDNTIKLWDAATGRLLQTLEGHSGRVMSVAFSSDGRTIVSGGADDKSVRLWRAAS